MYLSEEYSKWEHDFLEQVDVANKYSVMLDGPLDPTIWNQQSPRILFYYKESYGYVDCGENMRNVNYYEQWIKDRIATWRKAAVLSWLLHSSWGAGKIVEFDQNQLKKLYQDDSKLIEALRKTAFVNVNKVSNAANKTIDAHIRNVSRHQAQMLSSQIRLLSPDIIITGGRVCADSLYYDLNVLPKQTYLLNSVEKCGDVIVAPIYHLSASVWYKYIYDVHANIIETRDYKTD